MNFLHSTRIICRSSSIMRSKVMPLFGYLSHLCFRQSAICRAYVLSNLLRGLRTRDERAHTLKQPETSSAHWPANEASRHAPGLRGTLIYAPLKSSLFERHPLGTLSLG